MAYIRTHIRGVIYIKSALLAGIVYIAIANVYSGTLQTIRLEEWYGFIALAYLLAALLPTPLYKVFPTMPGKLVYTRARRAIGIATFCFALLHASISFFGLLQGFHGIPFLDHSFVIDLLLSFVALIILGLMAFTSNDFSVRLMGPWWKRLHRFVYLTATLVVLHILTIGSNFTDLTRFIPMICLILLFVFLVLELLRVDTTFADRYGYSRRANVFFIVGAILLVVGYVLITGHGSLSEHVHHLKNISHD